MYKMTYKCYKNLKKREKLYDYYKIKKNKIDFF